MEMVDKGLLELDGEYVPKEEIDKLADKILEIKRCKSRYPQRYEAASKQLVADGKLIEADKDLKAFAAERSKLEEEIKELRANVNMKQKTLRQKMEQAAREYGKKKSSKDEDEEDEQ